MSDERTKWNGGVPPVDPELFEAALSRFSTVTIRLTGHFMDDCPACVQERHRWRLALDVEQRRN